MFSCHRLLYVVLFVVMQCTVNMSAIAADPTKPAYYKNNTIKKQFRLESILISEHRKVAVINGIVVAEGDKVDGSTVVTIDKENVRVSRSGKIIDLVLNAATIRQEK